jgi:ABC-type lipoprotein release transport system permease subunit
MNNERTASAIGSTLGHAQIHSKGYLVDPKASEVISPKRLEVIENILKSDSRVVGTLDRAVFQTMVAAPKTVRASRLLAVNAEKERSLTTIANYMVEGNFFEDAPRKGIVISQKLSERLGVGLNKKLVLTFQDHNGTLQKVAFRVSGIYKTLNAAWDELNVYVQSEDLEKILGQKLVHEMVLRYAQTDETDAVTESIAAYMPKDVEIRSWKVNSPELGYADQMMGIMLVLVLGIIMLALLFGIINNMLMAILERRRELGMLMAVGMNKLKLFTMILLETLLLGIVGGPIGILLGDLTIRALMDIGINLSDKQDGLAKLGVQSVIYPEIVPEYYLIVAVMVVVTALIAAILPAIKALKLNPVQAIRGE